MCIQQISITIIIMYGLLFAYFTFTTQNVIVVQVPRNRNPQPKNIFHDGYTLFSYAMLLVCIVFGGLQYLLCIIPAYILSISVSLSRQKKIFMCIVVFYLCNLLINIIMQAQKDEEQGNDELAKKKRRGVLALNISAIVCFVITVISAIIAIVVVTSPAARAAIANWHCAHVECMSSYKRTQQNFAKFS